MARRRISLSTGAYPAIAVASMLGLFVGCDSPTSPVEDPVSDSGTDTDRSGSLPRPVEHGERSLEAVLASRRSVRDFKSEPLTDEQISQLLWAAQGVTDPNGFRTAPSAGALYPLELYVATASGFYHYRPQEHQLRQVGESDLRPALHRVALAQDPVAQAPAVFVITAVISRTETKYGQRAERYVHMEVGHAAQNLLLQAVALGLAGVPIGAFDDAGVSEVLQLADDEVPLYLLPVGHPR